MHASSYPEGSVSFICRGDQHIAAAYRRIIQVTHSDGWEGEGGVGEGGSGWLFLGLLTLLIIRAYSH